MWERDSRNTWLGVVVCACNPSTWEAEAGGLGVQGQPGLSETKKLKKQTPIMADFNIWCRKDVWDLSDFIYFLLLLFVFFWDTFDVAQANTELNS